MIWKALCLSTLQKIMLKLGNLLFKKHVLGIGPGMWLGSLLLKRLCDLWSHLTILAEARNRDGVIQEGSTENAFA